MEKSQTVSTVCFFKWSNVMIHIDGSTGEGGGQMLRTALSLSMVTQQPFRITHIRAGRKKPGLLRQHLTGVNAAAEISGAQVRGAELQSSELTFVPGPVRPGDYQFAVGSAGSASLVLQTILPPLLLSDAPSTLVLEGGTHNSGAPPFDFLDKAFLPLINRMGPKVEATLERPGFYPAGGGQFTVRIQPTARLQGIELMERGEIRVKRAVAIVAGDLPLNIAERELKALGARITMNPEDVRAEYLRNSRGPGNILTLEIETDCLTEVVTGFGHKGVSAETVGEEVAEEARRYLGAGVAVGPYLADQLLLPLALSGSGRFATLPLTLHSTTNIEIIKKFLPVRFESVKATDQMWSVEIQK